MSLLKRSIIHAPCTVACFVERKSRSIELNMVANLYFWHESRLSISAMFDCNVLFLCYFFANKLPILQDGFLLSLSNLPFLLKKVLGHFLFSMALGGHLWSKLTPILLLNFLKKCPLGVQPLGMIVNDSKYELTISKWVT